MGTLVQVTNLNKSFGPRVIFDTATVTIAERQKIGVVGRNGAGKSTLLKIIVGEEEYNSGEIADKLFIHVRTAEGHRNHLLLKTGCRNTAGLVLFAIKYNLFQVEI